MILGQFAAQEMGGDRQTLRQRLGRQWPLAPQARRQGKQPVRPVARTSPADRAAGKASPSRVPVTAQDARSSPKPNSSSSRNSQRR